MSESFQLLGAVIDGIKPFSDAATEEAAQAIAGGLPDRKSADEWQHRMMVELEMLSLAREMLLPVHRLRDFQETARMVLNEAMPRPAAEPADAIEQGEDAV